MEGQRVFKKMQKILNFEKICELANDSWADFVAKPDFGKMKSLLFFFK